MKKTFASMAISLAVFAFAGMVLAAQPVTGSGTSPAATSSGEMKTVAKSPVKKHSMHKKVSKAGASGKKTAKAPSGSVSSPAR